VLAARKPADAGALDKVFPTEVTDLTRRKDFLAAGLARVETYDRNGLTKKRIVTEDEEGRVIDLHAMRTTLGTELARQGVASQIAQQIMRHRDYRTTLWHYTSLSLADATKGMEEVPRVALGGPQNGPHSGYVLPHSGALGCTRNQQPRRRKCRASNS
jgi:integrase